MVIFAEPIPVINWVALPSVSKYKAKNITFLVIIFTTDFVEVELVAERAGVSAIKITGYINEWFNS